MVRFIGKAIAGRRLLEGEEARGCWEEKVNYIKVTELELVFSTSSTIFPY